MSPAITVKTPRKLIMRLDTWLSQKREQHARGKGKTPTTVPFMSYGSTTWLRVLGRTLLLNSPYTQDAEQLLYNESLRGWRSFMSVAAANEKVKVVIEGKTIGIATSDHGGVLDATFQIELDPGWHTIEYITSTGNYSATRIYIIAPDKTIGIISDVDDTIINTVLPKPLVAAWNSFVLSEQARLAVPGMPVLLDHLKRAHPGMPVIYLSTGAWNAAPALSRFLKRHLYPEGPLLLTDWGPTPDRWFRSGKAHKRRELRRLAHEFPHIKWLLVGDDGQHDEPIYREFALEFPDHISAVAIRRLSTGEAILAGGRSKAGMQHTVNGVPWVYGRNGAELLKELRKLHML
ncbi:App1 family protein [Canibacter zhuwentaonis]|uniref:App1 family protein n=1 Tax=Canibacter zhuwentaonis TaxID=2837491 RepID=UPI00350EFDA3